MLTDDIESGSINAEIKLPEAVRAALEARIKPMPERAAELREIFEQGFDEPFVPKVWRGIAYTAGIGTGDFKYSYELAKERYLGKDIPTYFYGIQASEGVFAMPIELNNPNAMCLPETCFMEFLPVDAEDDFSKALTMGELEVGKEYEIIVTNTSGLYRYRMRDAVRVTDRYNNTPCIIFLHRLDQTISLMGEKTTVTALRDAAAQTAEKCGFDMVDFSVYPGREAQPPRYVYVMEIDRCRKNITEEEIRAVLEKCLAEANPSMGDKVKRGICGNTALRFANPETYMLYRDLMIAKGSSASQLKPVRIIKDGEQKRFFFGLSGETFEWLV